MNMIYRALKQRRTAESLATFVQQYCQEHYRQVCAAVFNHELAQRASFVGRSRQASDTGLDNVPPLYSFYVAIAAGQALELFDSWAEGKRAAAPVGIEEISRLAADVLVKTLQLDVAEAEAVIDGVLAEIEALDAAAQQAKGKSDNEFAENIAAMESHSARIVLVYLAAEKTADQLFDAWRADPTMPPIIDIETATEYANLLGAIAEEAAAAPPTPAFAPQAAPQAPIQQPVREPAMAHAAAPEAPAPRAPTAPAPVETVAPAAPAPQPAPQQLQPATQQPAPPAAPQAAPQAPAAAPARVVVTPPPPRPAPQGEIQAPVEPVLIPAAARTAAPQQPAAAPADPAQAAQMAQVTPQPPQQPAPAPAAPAVAAEEAAPAAPQQQPAPAQQAPAAAAAPVQLAAADGGWPNLKLAG